MSEALFKANLCKSDGSPLAALSVVRLQFKQWNRGCNRSNHRLLTSSRLSWLELPDPIKSPDPVRDVGDGLVATERVGFEPTDAFTSLVFKTRAINHSTTSPGGTNPG